MKILGISPLDKDATAALVEDGRVTWAIGEERLSRKKQHAGFPRRAIQMILERARISPNDIDHVVYSFLDADKEAELMRRNLASDWALNRSPRKESLASLISAAQKRVTPRDFAVHGLKNAMETMVKPWWKNTAYQMFSGDGWLADAMNHRQFQQWIDNAVEAHQRYQQELIAGLKEFGLEHKLERVEHHLTHVANAFYFSGFEKALVVTLDGYGSGLSGTVTLADDKGFQRLHRLETPTSLGTFYEAVTSALGFNPDRHAGKIVGLAAYGDPDVLGPVLHSLFEWQPDGGFRMRRASDVYLARHLATHFPKIDVAAAYQRVLEDVVCRYVAHFVKQTGVDAVCLSGGVAANVKMNQRVFEIPGVKRIYIHQDMGDGGCGTGAAMLKAVRSGCKPYPLPDAYLGPEYSEQQILDAMKAAELTYERHDDIEVQIARLIADDFVVGRFHGRMEYGPRALGNRSILYPARDPEVNQWLNHRLGRTEFMPFAPVTLYEDRHKCYKNIDGAEYAAQFMTITFDCTDFMKQNCPAAVHVDGTARPQLITRECNPSYYRILSEYKKLTGVPSVINTSFNMHEEPIVCSPSDAIRAFQLGKLDYLAIGPYLVKASDLDPSRKRQRREAVPV